MKKKRKNKKIIYITGVIALVVLAIFLMNVDFKKIYKKTDLKGELATLSGSLNQELIAYYKFDGNANDELGMHDGIIIGPNLASGISGQSYKFDFTKDIIEGPDSGSPDYESLFHYQDYIKIPFSNKDNLDFSNKPKITTSFWLNLNKIPSDNDIGSRPLYWEDHETIDGNEKIQWFAKDNNDGTYKLSWTIKSSQGKATTTCNNIPYNKWYMFTGTYGEGNEKVYKNGVLCESISLSGDILPTNSGDDWIVSNAATDRKRGIMGKLDELAIYNRVLSQQEIESLYSTIFMSNITRSINNNQITLSISLENLHENEILMIAEKIPSEITIIPNSWNYKPTYNINNTLVWLFTNNPYGRWLGNKYVNQTIPSEVYYEISGDSEKEIRGKWGLEIKNKEDLISGENLI